jgi:hypothetical protein
MKRGSKNEELSETRKREELSVVRNALGGCFGCDGDGVRRGTGEGGNKW